ncbi:MAG: DUF547 domain-containing protein [Flavobacteriales bacterium]|nr:DUF547 domain-containing protein [Flavobacteriales bacterium]
MKLFKFIVFPAILSLCSSLTFAQENKTHETWTELLQKYVDSAGHVNYKGFIEEKEKFHSYLCALEQEAPQDDWTENEKLAYWINAYNAFTVELIIDNYPVKSIKELGGKLFKINTSWDIKFIHIDGETYDLNNIEHGIIRKNFNEPRIHFAVNCASVSCPKLRNEAYVGSKLDAQLEDQVRYFLKNENKNILGTEKAKLSKIFRWFTGDFTENMSLVEFINQYSEVKLTEETELEYLDYNWNLNE